jgi:hypothetical protein
VYDKQSVAISDEGVCDPVNLGENEADHESPHIMSFMPTRSQPPTSWSTRVMVEAWIQKASPRK